MSWDILVTPLSLLAAIFGTAWTLSRFVAQPLEKQMTGLDKRIDGLEARLDRVETRFSGRFDELTNNIRELRTELLGDITDLRADTKMLEGKVGSE